MLLAHKQPIYEYFVLSVIKIYKHIRNLLTTNNYIRISVHQSTEKTCVKQNNI